MSQTRQTEDGRLSLSIFHKAALCMGSLVLLVLTSFWLLLDDQVQRSLQLQADELGETLALQTAESITELVLANDQLSLNVVLNHLARRDGVGYAAVFDVDGRLIAAAGNNPGNRQASTSPYSAQISLQDSVAGTLRLTLDQSRVEATLQRAETYFLVILGLGLALALAVAYTLAQHLGSPLRALAAALNHPEEGSIDPDPRRGDEVGQVQQAAANLLSAQQDELWMPRQRPRQNTSQRTQACLMHVQVVDMETALEVLHPQLLGQLTDEYLYYLQQACRLYGGVVNRLQGDGALVIFDAHQATDDFSFNAACCAQLFNLLMQEVKQRHLANGEQALAFRLALHSGEVLQYGAAGSNSDTLLGETVENTLRLCGLARPWQIIISANGYKHAGGEERLASDVGPLLAEGNNHPALDTQVLILDRHSRQYSLLRRQATRILPEPEEA